MNKDQIRDRLKLLYRRHNRAASSLDAKTRAEADTMLDAIVAIREDIWGHLARLCGVLAGDQLA